MRWLLLAVTACSSSAPADTAPRPVPDAGVAARPAPKPEKLPPHDRYPDLGAALTAIIPADARVVGFGELHARVDRPNVRSSLSIFTGAIPAIGEKVSDLIVETWIVDPKCGKAAVATTKKIETDVKRPEATKSEIQLLADAAKTAKILPHAMTLGCKDYEILAPKGTPDPLAMLTLTTKELTRIALSAVAHRTKEGNKRPWITLYGGALHNDRFPDPAVAEWSYAATVDKATANKFVEVDIIAPELAEPDVVSQKQPWFPLISTAKEFRVWKRGERSFVIVTPRTK
jgi:hypothetical protein